MAAANKRIYHYGRHRTHRAALRPQPKIFNYERREKREIRPKAVSYVQT